MADALASPKGVDSPVRESPSAGAARPRWAAGAVLALVVALMFGLNLSAPWDLEGTNEARVAFYVLDLLETGNWLCPRDGQGRLISKPPVYTWLASAFSAMAGGVHPLPLRLPSVLALWLTGWMLYEAGRRHFSPRAGPWAAAAFLFTPMAIVTFAQARYDVLFSCLVAWSALAAYAAWERGRGWLWFWLGAAGATLVKGPFGLALAAAGLLAWVWEWRGGRKHPLRGSAWPGLALFFAIAGGWFVLAYRQEGQALVDKMILGELVNHAVGQEEGGFPGSSFHKPILTFLTDGAPWSWFAVLGLYRVLRHPASAAAERRFERFLWCWFIAGLLILALATHQRARLLFPLMPPAALIAGREIARLLQSPAAGRRWLWGAVALGLLGTGVFYHLIQPRRSDARLTGAAHAAAQELNALAGDVPLQHANSVYAVQYFRRELLPLLSLDQARELLRDEGSAYVAVSKVQDLAPLEEGWHVLYERQLDEEHRLAVIGNAPAIQWTERMAYRVGPVEARWRRMRLLESKRQRLELEVTGSLSELKLLNSSSRDRRMTVVVREGNEVIEQSIRLAPGASWLWPAAGP